jgi:tripeptide aminopeptidase
MYDDEMRALMGDERVRAALDSIVALDSDTLRDQVELTEIPAPPFGESRRAREFLLRLEALGVDDAGIDEAGNVVALRRGNGADAVVAVSAHLDTVFPEGTDVTVHLRGETLAGPGIADDGRGLAVVLALLRTLNQAGVRTEADLLLVGTVGEEGTGDLRGVKHLFREGAPRIDAFLSIDGSDPARIIHLALGSLRYRVTFRGPGGHSWASFGTVHPGHALGRAIVLLDEAGDRLGRKRPRISYGVGRLGGGTSVNSIPSEVWMEVDLRAGEDAVLRSLDAAFRDAVRRAAAEADDRRTDGRPLEVEIDRIGDRPGGGISAADPLVQRAVAASRVLSIEPNLSRGSTDANVPLSRGIPALTLGGGGRSGRTHTLEEWFENADGPRGVQRVLLVLLAQAGLAGRIDGRRSG